MLPTFDPPLDASLDAPLAALRRRFGRGGAGGDAADCRCETRFVGAPGPNAADRSVLELDAGDCDGGDLSVDARCRATAVRALAERDADAVRVLDGGFERTYLDGAAALLLAAGRFHERVRARDERLAERAARDPTAAAREATGRAGPVSRIAGETGMALFADCSLVETLRAYEGPAVAGAHVASTPPPDARLEDVRTLSTGAQVRIYETGRPCRTYHLSPAWTDLPSAAFETLADARELLARGAVRGGDRAPARAVERVAGETDPVERLSAILARHTAGNGALEDVFADDRVTDAFLTAPVADNPLRVVVDGERMRTNVRFPPERAAALASRLRRTSGRPLSRAAPALDATLDVAGDEIRVAAVAEPASDGVAAAFRRRARRTFTVAALVADGTLPASAAAFLSLAVERSANVLVAGGRGAGKTTLLGALLWELPGSTRTVVVEDTPELPVDELQRRGRDVQRLTVAARDGSFDAAAALRAALRLGDGALVVGEVRGEEAASLFESMRVGARGDAVLGTIHGEGGEAICERAASDLGVPPSSFAATDLVITFGADRRLARVEELRVEGDDVAFEPLFRRESGPADRTSTLPRGDSTVLGRLANPDERYADLLDALDRREAAVRRLAETGATGSADVRSTYGPGQ